MCRKKIEKGDPLVSSGFVGYLKKVKDERGPFALSLHWPDLGLGSFRSFSDQCEVCGLKKKRSLL